MQKLWMMLLLAGCNGGSDDGDVKSLQTEVEALTTQLDAANATNDELMARVEALERDTKDLLAVVEVKGDNVTFTGVNVRVVSGSGSTDDGGSPTGLGNVIIGYDEDSGDDEKSGSHSLVVGSEHSYTGVANVVSGVDADVSGDYAAAIGGFGNEVSGYTACAVGGSGNVVSQQQAVAVAGGNSVVSGPAAATLGGDNLTAAASKSVVVGGSVNSATGVRSVVAGGTGNSATTTEGTAPY